MARIGFSDTCECLGNIGIHIHHGFNWRFPFCAGYNQRPLQRCYPESNSTLVI
ncbi:MAG: hypothetical protein JWM59_4757 [Verrucomicrobiales bacterium]|nr:hypothetical protein [Verrucomicrobiales bacterium]